MLDFFMGNTHMLVPADESSHVGITCFIVIIAMAPSLTGP